MQCASPVSLKNLLLSFKDPGRREECLEAQFLEEEYSIKHL